MEDFIATVTDERLRERLADAIDERLRERLADAIDGRSAFGRFKRVLSNHDEERGR